MFKRISGQPNIIALPKKASTAWVAGAVLAAESSIDVTKATSSSSTVVGVALETIATTDGDYATVRPTLIDIPDARTVYEGDVTGTLTTAMVGQYLKLSTELLADAGTATGTPAAALILMCVGFISATKGLFIFNGTQYTRPAA